MEQSDNQGIKSTKRAFFFKKIQAHMLVKYVPFVLFLSILAAYYISNGHKADNIIRQTAEAKRILKQRQYEYKTLKAEVMYRSKESEMAIAVKPLGLEKPELPPIIVKSK